MKPRISPRFAVAGRLFLGALALWLVAGIGAPPSAEANTAATAIIRNTATVKYNNAAGVPQADITATSDVKVTLVASTPTLSAPADQNTVVGTNAVYTYYLTSNANGLDTYNLTSAIASQSGISGSNATVPASITLGASSVAIAIPAGGIPAAGTYAITVPSDDTPASGAINGIAVGQTIVILGQAYTVASIVDNGGVGTSTITVNGNGTASGAIPAGTQIGQRGSFSLTVTPGTLSGAADGFVNVNVSARDAANAQPATPVDLTITTVQAPRLSVTKEVSIDGGATFPAGIPNAAPGATLTYRITVTNNGSSNATSVVITDPMTIFTTYQAGTAKKATGAATTYAAAPTALTDTNGDGDGYDYTAGTATYNVGTVIPGAANAVQLFFQVKIN
ncbi:DUF11 domain-containing protein [Geobacter sp. AOG1]|uniref:DUF11 domain-containing protein n=1 Tax=Geobacter sp. AOG1 TaxID=1566346 RepID=UPI001CC503BD|nr:DUF11 domain-containing protein [Geobacter sp. AOG1]GFE57587.1 hypothetical protein AOG1_14670 [Geobacter sp. AOG1]